MPSFNWRLALQSGYTPEEIQAHLDSRGLSDEALIQRQLGGKPMLPYSYGPDLDMPPPAAAPTLPPELSGAPQTFGRNPRTGEPMRGGYIPIVDDPLEGLTDIAGTLDRATPNQWYGPHGDQGAATLSQLTRGAMRVGTPLLPAALATAPVRTLAGLGMGSLMGSGTEEYLKHRGVAPGYAALGGDVAGLFTGYLGAEAPWQTLPDLLRAPRAIGQRGAIEISPSTGWTSTLRDLIEAKAPERVHPQQLAGIAAQASPEEVRWSGLDWTGQPWAKPPFAKQDVLSTIGQPKIEEILLTAPDTSYDRPGLSLPGGEGQTSKQPHA
jgi:hypothetical protein